MGKDNRSPYKTYDKEQVEKFVDLLQEQGLSVVKAAQQSGIPRSTAYGLRKQFNLTGSLLNRGKEPQEMPEHYTRLLVNYIDQHPDAELGELQTLINRSPLDSVTVTKVRLKAYMEQACAFSLQETVPFHPVLPPLTTPSLGEGSPCLFLDQIRLTRRPWGQRTYKGIDVVFWGLMSMAGPLAVFKQGPGEEDLDFLACAMAETGLRQIVLNPHRVRYEKVQQLVLSHGGQCVFWTGLHPMQPCWNALKTLIPRSPLNSAYPLSDRIQLAWKSIRPSDCLCWIQECQTPAFTCT
ncbi:hypothetical protein BY458DRAFT_507207 [Sporodiniella umbellata]|nr:hypothetical protein BY458DRAFT_507207 [Sporodiniella umbellata]